MDSTRLFQKTATATAESEAVKNLHPPARAGAKKIRTTRASDPRGKSK